MCGFPIADDIHAIICDLKVDCYFLPLFLTLGFIFCCYIGQKTNKDQTRALELVCLGIIESNKSKQAG